MNVLMGTEHDSWLNYFGIDVDKILGGLSGDTTDGERAKSSTGTKPKPKPAGAGLPISKSVGKGGKNLPDDVKTVQEALNSKASAGLPVDGHCRAPTIKAIKDFQKSLGAAKPDGRVDPGKATALALAGAAPAHASEDPGSTEPEDQADSEDLFDRMVDGAKDIGGKLIKRITNGPPEPEIDVDAERNEKITSSILKKLKSGDSLKPEIQVLEGKSRTMESLLDIMDRLKQAGKLNDFDNHADTTNPRIGAAMLTARGDFGEALSKLISKLSAADREAVLERTPDEFKKSNGFETDPEEGSETEKGDEDNDASITVGGKGEIEGTLGFKNKGTELGEIEFTVKVDELRNLGAIEIDLKLIQQELTWAGAITDFLALDVSLSLNTSIELTEEQGRVLVERVREKLKAQVELHFRRIEALKKVRLQFSASGGMHGFNLGPAIVIKF